MIVQHNVQQLNNHTAGPDFSRPKTKMKDEVPLFFFFCTITREPKYKSFRKLIIQRSSETKSSCTSSFGKLSANCSKQSLSEEG